MRAAAFAKSSRPALVGIAILLMSLAFLPKSVRSQCLIETGAFVSARDNALVGGQWASYWMAEDAGRVRVSASGSAFAGAGVEFGAVIVNYRLSNRDAFYHVLPKNGTIEVIDHYPGEVYLWFTDVDGLDNSGQFVLTFDPEVGPTVQVIVDPAVHWFPEDQALTVELPSILLCTAEATGYATFAGPDNRYKTVGMIYFSNSAPPMKMYAGIATGEGSVAIGTLADPVVSLFFTDTYAGDNVGGFDVRFRLDGVVPLDPTSWGQIKEGWFRTPGDERVP